MRTKSEENDPWQTADPALAVAIKESQWYEHAARRARIAHQVSEVLLLVLSAATTVAAALAATAWLTAALAAGTLVVTGLRKSFDWHENWLTFTARRSELRSIIHQYRLLPEDRRDAETQRRLLVGVDEIFSSETGNWASRRRKLHDSTQH
jgi:hypothetical protein